MAEEIIVFEVAGEWAHFKRPYTTTSPLTFDLPSPPTILGFLGAILGIDKREYLAKLTRRCLVSAMLNQFPQKWKTGLKFLDTEKSSRSFRAWKKNPHSPIEVELLCDAGFRFFCGLEDRSLMQNLATRLQEHRPYYVPSLGLAWCLADFQWIGSFPASRVNPEQEIEVLGWLPQSAIAEAKLENEKRYHMMTLPVTMEPGRRISRYDDIIYEHSGKTIRCKLKPGETVWQIQHGGKIAEQEISYVYLL